MSISALVTVVRKVEFMGVPTPDLPNHVVSQGESGHMGGPVPLLRFYVQPQGAGKRPVQGEPVSRAIT